MSQDGRSCPPTDEELKFLGLEPWQIAVMRRHPMDIQWAVHDEILRNLMSGGDGDVWSL
jgi:hypothetical protein